MNIGLGRSTGRAPRKANSAALDQAFPTKVTFSTGDIAATLTANQIAAVSSSTAKLNAAAEFIFGQSKQLAATGTLSQPSNSLPVDTSGTAMGAGHSGGGSSSSTIIQSAPSPLFSNVKNVPADDPGQEDASNDPFKYPAVKFLFGR